MVQILDHIRELLLIFLSAIIVMWHGEKMSFLRDVYWRDDIMIFATLKWPSQKNKNKKQVNTAKYLLILGEQIDICDMYKQ